eukprot:366226-Chlamydomonas_euryale.AAC.22
MRFTYSSLPSLDVRSWWKEYAARKNDEEEEHVADSLLYDERCHLPRMVPAPDVVTRARNQADAPRTPEHPDTSVGEKRPHDGSGGESRPMPQGDKPR